MKKFLFLTCLAILTLSHPGFAGDLREAHVI